MFYWINLGDAVDVYEHGQLDLLNDPDYCSLIFISR